MVTTDNMGLLLPTVQVTPGPTYGTENNDAFTIIDEHDHSTGKGIAIKPSGLNINSDLSIQSNDLTNVNAVALDNLSAPETNVSRVNQSGGDLYWTNAGGTAVQITSGASVNSSSSGISRSFSPSAISSNTVIGASDTFSYYLVNTGASVTFTLPAANGVSSGRFYEFKDVTGGAATHNITLTPDGTDTIDGQGSYTINVPYGQVRIVSDGTSKWNLNQFPITASKAAVSDSTGKVVASTTTATEVGYLAGMFSQPICRSAITSFTSSGTWTKATLNPKFIRVTVVGGGGAGGGASATGVSEGASGGGGGGGGCSIKTILAASLGVTETVTVGTGGVAVSGNNGGSGTSSSFGSHASATGGQGGTLGNNTVGSTASRGGDGGLGASGDVNFYGSDGFVSQVISGSPLRTGAGGSSYLGGSIQSVNLTGQAGKLYGGGGSGAQVPASTTAKAGGNGAIGIVIVEEFY